MKDPFNVRSRWFAWIIWADEPLAAEAIKTALAAGAEVYRHGGIRPHYHVLLYFRSPRQLRRVAFEMGRGLDEHFGVCPNPDATRRYMRNGGKLVTQVG